MSAAWQTAALVLRALSTRHQLSYDFFIPSQILILLAPVWTNAFCYIVLGRMIHFFILEGKTAGVGSRRLTLLFMLLDIVSFIIQGTGSSMASNTDKGSDSLRIARRGLGIRETWAVQVPSKYSFFVLGDRIPEENASRLGPSTIPIAPTSVYHVRSPRLDHVLTAWWSALAAWMATPSS